MQQIFSMVSRERRKNLIVIFSLSQITSCKSERTSYRITASVLIKRGKSALLHWQDQFYVYPLWEHEALEEGSLH